MACEGACGDAPAPFSPWSMTSKLLFLLLPALTLALTSCTAKNRVTVVPREPVDTLAGNVVSDSRIRGPGYDAIVDEMENLEKGHPMSVTLLPYGESVAGRPLTMIRIARGPALDVAPGLARSPAVLITGAIHGGEYLGIEDRLPRRFLEDAAKKGSGIDRFLARGGTLYLAPVTNPDGYEGHFRANARGKDLNRDFSLARAGKNGFTQPETRGLVSALRADLERRGVELRLTLDYHCCAGALIYPWGHSRREKMPLSEELAHRRIADLMLEGFQGYGVGQAADVIGYTAVGASDDYYHEAFGARAFTFEGTEALEHTQFELHAGLWERVLADLAR